jgi:glycosyltransferase involved in cell wall biosynthesis
VSILHFHWPQGFYRHERGPGALRAPLSWLRLGLFGVRLRFARACGYRVAWTIHQVYPHERRSSRQDHLAARLLALSSHVLLTHDRATAEAARSALGLREGRITVVPHGSYIGVYPPGRPRSVVREELGLPEAGFVFLCFGELRRNTGVEVLLAAWTRVGLEGSALVVAGNPKDPQAGEAVRNAAAADPRIRSLLEFCPPESVAELFGACDAVVLPRSDGGTSGSLLLALSLGLPVIAADVPNYRELVGRREAGWTFRPGDARSLAAALEQAASDVRGARTRGDDALAIARALDWSHIGARTAALLRGDPHGPT